MFEGLPVRRWTRQHQTVSQAPKPDEAESIFQGPGGKQTLPEHPMPRDSQLLTPTSKALLRAARAGCIYIRQAPKEAEDINLIINEEKETTDVEEGGAAASGQPKAERSFVTRKWMTVPRHMEPPEVEFLAKRRPGLPSLYGAAATGIDGAPNVPMRRTRFKKMDPVTGNVSVYEAWVPEGHRIEGEIAADDQVVPGNAEATVNSEAPAPGTVVEGVGTVNAEGVVVAEAGSAAVMTPPKRRPPPPKRKGKGFKGRRKKVMFAPGEGADASAVHGAEAGVGDGATDGVKSEDGDASRGDQAGQEDEEDDGEEGEESDEGDESMMDAKTPETLAAEPAQPTQTPQPVPAETAPEPQAPGNASQAAEQALAPISDKPSDEMPATEDVTMADYQAEPAASEPQIAPDAQQPTAPEQLVSAAKTTTENQLQAEQTTVPPTPEESSEKPQETVKTEPGQQDNQDVMDTLTDLPIEQQEQPQQEQPQEQETAPKPEPEQEHDTTTTENQDVDVLGTLEKSLDVSASSEQTETQPKHEAETEPEPEQTQASTEPAAPASEPVLAAVIEKGPTEEQPSTKNQEVERPAEEQQPPQPQPQQEQEQQPKKEVEDQPPVQQPSEQPQEQHPEEKVGDRPPAQQAIEQTQEQQQQQPEELQPTEIPAFESTESTKQPAEPPAEQPKEEPEAQPQPQQEADEVQQEQEQQEQPPAPAQQGEPGQN